MLKLCLFSLIALFFLAMSLVQESSLPSHNIYISDADTVYEDVTKDGVFSNGGLFFIISKIPLLKHKIKKGEYCISQGESAYSFMIKILTGDMVIRKMVFPEGYTTKMIVEKLNNEEALIGKITEMPEEGSLFPSAYFYKKNDSKESIIKKMENQMQVVKKDLFSNGQLQNPEFIKKTIILASIIEKESSNPEERNLISSVFQNRLAKGMRLQSCPTVIYAMSDGYGKIDHPLTKNDLWFESPYNTYRNNGLPPTPICCPSKQSISAALFPSTTEFLFFVATKDNTKHLFSTNYQDHLKNVKTERNG